MKKYVATLLAVIFVLTSPALNVSSHYDTAYWHDTFYQTDRSRWMSPLLDHTPLNKLSIPGTHDSMAHKSDLAFVDNTRTQSLSLEDQLKAGIRYLDIRLKYSGDSFHIHHGFVYVGYNFEDVLSTVQQFLRNNPSETVLMRVKQEHTSASDSEMATVFNTYYNRYKNLFWHPSQSTNPSNPVLQETRGKIVLMPDILSLAHYGINYRNLNTQDYYSIPNNWELYTKWEKVKEHLKSADNSTNSSIFLNYLSASSSGVMPYFVASGHSNPATGAPRLATGLTEPAFHHYYPDFPRVNWLGSLATIAFEGINTLAADYIKSNIKHTGIVVADFPGERLIANIISLNENLGPTDGRVYSIGLRVNPAKVIDINNVDSTHNATIFDYNGGNNQKFKFVYSYDKKAWQIMSMMNEDLVLAWNDYAGSNNVFITPNAFKPEHYWDIYEVNNGVFTIKNHKYDGSKSLYLENGTLPNLTNAAVGFVNDSSSQFILY